MRLAKAHIQGYMIMMMENKINDRMMLFGSQWKCSRATRNHTTFHSFAHSTLENGNKTHTEEGKKATLHTAKVSSKSQNRVFRGDMAGGRYTAPHYSAVNLLHGVRME